MKRNYRFILLGLFAILVFSAVTFAQKGTNVEKRINFAKGKSSATVKSSIADRLTTHEYKVGAKAGQTLTVIFTSPRKDVDVCLTFPNGGEPGNSCGQRKYVVTLADTGDYSIIIDSKRENTAYTLAFSIK